MREELAATNPIGENNQFFLTPTIVHDRIKLLFCGNVTGAMPFTICSLLGEVMQFGQIHPEQIKALRIFGRIIT